MLQNAQVNRLKLWYRSSKPFVNGASAQAIHEIIVHFQDIMARDIAIVRRVYIVYFYTSFDFFQWK